jgi:hypothetical protein
MRRSVREPPRRHPYPLFAQALEAGSLKRIENVARQMPAIRLGDALRIVELMARDGDPATSEPPDAGSTGSPPRPTSILRKPRSRRAFLPPCRTAPKRSTTSTVLFS